ncbi:MAG TPA: T9SS type A sorting domain-containing protein [Melioribacteraceae bacterium]|nr:T9SS type A sorting domain-containing protein [Melioribacteraceae bacterium]
MIRKLTTLLLFVLFCSSLYSQTTPISFTVEPFGVSPRDVARSTTDIYTSAFTGLKNVGVNSQMYFKAVLTGQAIGTVTWSITRRPLGSTAAVGTTVHVVDDNTVVVTFKPDKVGAYELKATSGAYSATVGFNSAKYLGYTNTFVDGVNKNVNCQTCHPSYVTEWSNTGHATTLTEEFEGQGSDHFGANCISCHSTGHNTTAANDGFDDFPFTFPTVLAPGMTATLVAQFPDAMLRANVQCESCHGPGSTHLGATTDFRMVATYNPDVCAYCHDSGTHHLLPEQFDASVHAGVVDESGPGREGCVRCHTGSGFKQYVDNVSTSDPYFDVSYNPITCAGCHDPHNATNPHQLRKVTANLLAPNNTTITINQANAGNGAICFNCHQSRSEANAAAAAATLNSRFGPHYGAQGDMLVGNNMFELGGVKLASSNHFGITQAHGSCVACHMYGVATPVANGQVALVGGHSFAVTYPDGKSNMESCMPCHGGSLGLSFADVTFMLNGSLDHDNDGVNEGLQDEVHGMIDKIYEEVARQVGTTTIPPVPATSWSPAIRKAYWNARTAYYDHSYGIHNPKYIVTALKGAMASLGLATSVEQDEIVPTEYALFQNYPNPFNPTTNIKFAIPKASNVRVTIYDALGKEVRTLVNNYLSAGSHTFEFNARHLASGIYLYRIEADNFVKVNKMLLLK